MSIGPTKFFALRQFLREPLKTGAIAASGAELSKAMAVAANISSGDIVVELGPGTGVITAQLLACGVKPQQLMLVEFNSSFAAKLKKDFPRVNVVEGDAWEIGSLMQEYFPNKKCAAVVSSIPLLNFPRIRRSLLLSEVAKVLEPKSGRFVQFSYGPKGPIQSDHGFVVTKSEWIFKNIPPARVWTYH